MNKQVRKSQIGIFVLIATILVLLAILYFSFSDSFFFFDDERPAVKVRTFVEDCLETQTTQAIKEIGLHAGWLYHPDMLFTKRDDIKYLIQRAEGYEDLGGIELPYWHYYDDSEEIFYLNIPEYDSNSKYSLRSQVKQYVDATLEKECLKGFNIFDNEYNIRYEPKEIDVNVEFEGDNILTELSLPIEINVKNTQTQESVSSFDSVVDNKLKIPYYLARDITLAENSSSFVETRFVQFLYAYQDSDSRDLLPPFYQFELGYDFKPWSVPKVEELVKQIFNANIGLIQFLNTDYKVRKVPEGLEDSPFASSLTNLYTKDYLSNTSITKTDDKKIFQKFEDYTVKGSYEIFYPMFFSLAPSLGDIILMPHPEAFLNLIPIFFTEYNAVYEITTPVIFEIKNSKETNDDFVFRLPLELNIDHNAALKDNYDITLDEEYEANVDTTLLCDPLHFISAPVRINISDPVLFGERYIDPEKRAFNKAEEGVEDAIISFSCSGISSCFVGTTKKNGNKTAENLSYLEFRLPINCDPGTLEIYKYGHRKLVFENLDPTLDKEINLGQAYMPSEKNFSVSFKLLEPEETKNGVGSSLRDTDKAFLIIEDKVDEENTRVLEFTKETQKNLSIALLPGNYSIKGFLIDNKNITIPAEEICPGVSGLASLFVDADCQTIPSTTIESWLRGGIELQSFEVSLKDVVNNNHITFYFVNTGLPSSYSSLEAVSNKLGNLEELSKAKEPKFTYEK
ncbi:hypothetical protein H6501_00900 [Candidatus Woesearchaeota archaeon]|nr:hypothetical protein [Candidatus Woesearchaeota archaeon]